MQAVCWRRNISHRVYRQHLLVLFVIGAVVHIDCGVGICRYDVSGTPYVVYLMKNRMAACAILSRTELKKS